MNLLYETLLTEVANRPCFQYCDPAYLEQVAHSEYEELKVCICGAWFGCRSDKLPDCKLPYLTAAEQQVADYATQHGLSVVRAYLAVRPNKRA